MKSAVIITSINSPTRAVIDIAAKCGTTDSRFIVIGDQKSPPDFSLEGCDFFDIAAQRALNFDYARICPTKHYARKNIGYLIAMEWGAETIVETDDDNIPMDEFWNHRISLVNAPIFQNQTQWVNVYKYFSDELIWPRGLPLDQIHTELPSLESLPLATAFCPIQQGLADANPDVDAIYRLLLPLPVNFVASRKVVLGAGAWCPFNSQNTAWWPQVYPLLYLPYYCSFRMTDIWRSFVAQRIAWENGWSVLFHSSTVFQERNEHSLMRDFAEEVPGYLNNQKIMHTLSDLPLTRGIGNIYDNLRKCYDALIEIEVIGKDERKLLEAWITDCIAIENRPTKA